MLTRPDGTAIPATASTTELTTDQAAAVAEQMIDAQVGWLVRAGVPPRVIVTLLMDLASSILSGLEPADARRAVTAEEAKRFEKMVATKAGRRMIAAVTPRMHS